MMKKIQYATFILVALYILSGMLVAGYGGIDSGNRQRGYSVTGAVYDSYDHKVEIYNDTTGAWVCKNITVYSVDGTKLPELDYGTFDYGSNDTDCDTFLFNETGGFSWRSVDNGKEGICIGEAEVENISYVFITNFTFGPGLTDNWLGFCESTEWEPIPTPIVYLNGDTWLNLSIPKFTNSVINSLGVTFHPNTCNTIGFAVYRDNTFLGNATYSNNTHYFYNDSVLPGIYHYMVAPIAKGGYVTWGKSSSVELSVVGVKVNSPNGNERWSGNRTHRVNYTILYGTPDYAVELYCVNDTTSILIGSEMRIVAGTYITELLIPKIDSDKVKIRINVVDRKGLVAWDMSDDNFTIDSTPPEINLTSPSHNSSCDPTGSIGIEFTESMNVSTVKDAFSYTDGITTWTSANGSWDPDTGSAKVILFKPFENFSIGTQYNCTITTLAKDGSDPGNHLLVNYTWSFVAAPGRGNFSVEITYPPNEVYIGSHLVEVKVYNKPDAENRSGGLKLKFYTSSDGVNFTLADERLIPEMFPDNSTALRTYCSFPTPGTWYVKVNITLLSPEKDLIEGGKSYEDVYGPITVKLVPKVEEERPPIGLGPYALIALMVLLVIVIGFLVIAGYKKESEKKEKPAEEEEEEKKSE